MKIKTITIILILFSSHCFSQIITTKFSRNGYLQDNTNKTSNAICKFKQDKDVVIIDYITENWWKVNYKDCVGYIVEPFLVVTDEMIDFKDEKLLAKRYEKFKIDSINKFNIEQQKISELEYILLADSLTRNILNYVSDSLLVVNIGKSEILRSKPSIFGDVIYTTVKKEKAIVVDYGENAYYKICIDSNCGYVKDFSLKYSGLENSDLAIKLVNELKYKKEKDAILKEIDDAIAESDNKKEELANIEKSYIKKYGEKTYAKLKEHYYWIGMTKEMATISLGRPSDINRTVGSWGVHEQWIYSNIYLYFENGTLTSYQN